MVTTLSNKPQMNFTGTSNQCIIFGHTVEVLHCIHSLHRTNAIAKEINSSFSLDADILYQAIQHLLDVRPFSNAQLLVYFETQQSLEEFHRTLEDDLQVTFEAHLPYAVDFLLLGMEAVHYAEMGAEQRTRLHQHYETLLWELLQKELALSEFVSSAQNLVLEQAQGKQLA